MSVSDIKSNALTTLLAKEQVNVDKAQFRYETVKRVLESLPKDSPAPVTVNDFGYCAGASLSFKGEDDLLQTLLKLYPPVECIDLMNDSQTQKPAKYVRDEEKRGAIRAIYPVVLKTSGNETSARWWTSLAGLDTEVTVPVSHAATQDLAIRLGSTHEAQVHRYSTGSVTFFTRKLAEPQVCTAALAQWADNWMEYAKDRDFTDMQTLFWKALCKALMVNPYVSDWFLQDAAADMRKFHDTIWSDINKFSATFPEGPQVAQLASFVQRQATLLPKSRQLQAEQFASAKKWFLDFFSTKGRLAENDCDVQRRILHKLRKDTQLDVQVRMMRGGHHGVSVSVYFKEVDEYPDWTFSTNGSMWPIRPQDIDVDYV